MSRNRLLSLSVLLQGLILQVAGAEPLLIPPIQWTEPPPGVTFKFGESLDIDGDVAVVAGQGDQVYLYERDAMGQWQPIKTLTAPAERPAVAIDGDRLAMAVDLGEGEIHLFERDAGGQDEWGFVAQVTPQNAPPESALGTSIALDGDFLVAGSPLSQTGANRSGAAFIFEQTQPGAWTQVAIFEPDIVRDGSSFGFDVALETSTTPPVAIVGAPVSFDGGGSTDPDSGFAYIFERLDGTWTRTQRLISANAQNFDYFGHSVDIDGMSAVIGAWGTRPSSNQVRVGSAYVFERASPQSPWLEAEELVPAHRRQFEVFGQAVAISGDEILVGEPRDYQNGTSEMAGAAHLFRRNAGGVGQWGRVARIESSSPDNGDDFGLPVALDQGTALITSPTDDTLGFSRGAVDLLETGNLLLIDGFESGDTASWSAAFP